MRVRRALATRRSARAVAVATWCLRSHAPATARLTSTTLATWSWSLAFRSLAILFLGCSRVPYPTSDFAPTSSQRNSNYRFSIVVSSPPKKTKQNGAPAARALFGSLRLPPAFFRPSRNEDVIIPPPPSSGGGLKRAML
ncbi:hypothetical protein EVAR_23382_1 [Eumeta japonica]|uniref:Uncharacterized protein n=1 Tax=Eumeta variegata TaxID=151549 RepID=A0A4C1VXU5_EUMVA|nr:hypothetical protein EVAR_23382_1 [Eumeta japonica]